MEFVAESATGPRNSYETVGDIKVVSIDNFNQLEIANKLDYFTNLAACIL